MKETVMTIQELGESCAYWQEKLGLAHWDIGLRIARLRNMPSEGCVGNNEFSIATEKACISILDHVDYDSPFPQDMEITLVHELLHIPMSYISNPEHGTLEWAHSEAMIDRLAQVLVDLKRG